MKNVAHLALADGSVFKGKCLFEGDEIVTGELVFSTSNSGYTEILTDPSYYGQIVVLASPEIGNCGVNINDFQSDGIKVKALVVRNLSLCASSFRAHMTLTDWMLRENIPLIFGIDTRALISHIRKEGAMMATFSNNPAVTIFDLLQKAKIEKPMEGRKISLQVAITKPTPVDFPLLHIDGTEVVPFKKEHRIAVLDFGVKRSILRQLSYRGGDLILVPPEASPEEIWALFPDGVFLSNGPGDPKTETVAINTVKALLGKVPIFGVCLGHQILARSLGLTTYKLKFGHRGSNQAVKCQDRSIVTTAQNHGFAVRNPIDLERLGEDINISDGTNEGLNLPHLHAFSVQFHPEGAPGPLDALPYFEKFVIAIREYKRIKKLKAQGALIDDFFN